MQEFMFEIFKNEDTNNLMYEELTVLSQLATFSSS